MTVRHPCGIHSPRQESPEGEQSGYRWFRRRRVGAFSTLLSWAETAPIFGLEEGNQRHRPNMHLVCP